MTLRHHGRVARAPDSLLCPARTVDRLRRRFHPPASHAAQAARRPPPRAAAATSGSTRPRPCSAKGPRRPRLMFVGEQPGDQEDRAGRPFVGPAGRLLDEALDAAGIDRGTVYVTNAVKHFKFVRKELIKRRLHKKPSAAEVRACNPWLREEIRLVQPRAGGRSGQHGGSGAARQRIPGDPASGRGGAVGVGGPGDRDRAPVVGAAGAGGRPGARREREFFRDIARVAAFLGATEPACAPPRLRRVVAAPPVSP